MNKKFTALLMALLLALSLCVPAAASVEYGSIFDETEELGSAELTYQGEQKLPQLAKNLGIDLRVDVFTDEGLEPDDTVSDIATFIYGNYDYGLGEDKEGVSLTLLMKTQPDGSYALAENDWCVYAFLSETRGSSQELSDAVYAAIKPYMAAQAWNGEDMTMSATALSQAVDAMMKAASDYILANCPPDNSGEVTETQTPEQTGVDMKYIFDNSDLLTFDEWEKLEARAADISQRHGCGVYVAFVDDFTEYGYGNDVYKTTYQLYHANELGMGDDRDGIIILLSMAERDYAMFVYGTYAETAFNSYGQEKLEKAFLGNFKEDDWYGGVSNYLSTCDEYLTRADAGKPVRESPALLIAIAVVASCLLSGAICLFLKRSMKTVHQKVEANEYVAPGGLQLSKQYDRYTHTTEVRSKISSSDDSSSSGTSSCSGGGGSGRSGKF
jgi:uncharacterized membrane protein YgcG